MSDVVSLRVEQVPSDEVDDLSERARNALLQLQRALTAQFGSVSPTLILFVSEKAGDLRVVKLTGCDASTQALLLSSALQGLKHG